MSYEDAIKIIQTAPGWVALAAFGWLLYKIGFIRFKGDNGNGKSGIAKDIERMQSSIERIEQTSKETHDWLAREDADGVKRIYITDSMKDAIKIQTELLKNIVRLLESSKK